VNQSRDDSYRKPPVPKYFFNADKAPHQVRSSRGFVHNISLNERGALDKSDLLFMFQRLSDLETNINELREANSRLRALLYRNSFRVVWVIY